MSDSLRLLTGDPARLFRVRVLTDSYWGDDPGWPGARLTSFRLVFPRPMLVDFNTHRDFSRSTRSLRAVPPEVIEAEVRANPNRPMRFGGRQKGMGAGSDLPADRATEAGFAWDGAIADALKAAGKMRAAGVAKEEVNRLLEPFALSKTVVTSSRWDNYFAQRCHESAWTPFRFVARAMWIAYRASVPRQLKPGEWHLPFITEADHTLAGAPPYQPLDFDPDPFPRGKALGGWREYHLCRWSAARCARVSFGRADGTGTAPLDDDRTWANLIGLPNETPDECLMAALTHPAQVGFGEWPYRPVHGSPMEHQGTPVPGYAAYRGRYSGNLSPGWVQFRKLLGGECVTEFAPPADLEAAWAEAIPPAVFGASDPV